MAADRAMASNVGSIIGDKTIEITNEISKKLLERLLQLPSYFSQLLIIRCANNQKAEKTNKSEFLKVWKILEP